MTMGCVALSSAVMYDRLTFEREGKINSSQHLNQGTRIALFPKFVGVVLFPMFVGTPTVGRLLSWGTDSTAHNRLKHGKKIVKAKV